LLSPAASLSWRCTATRGGMCEWLKQAVLKTALPWRVTGVRIPLPPPSNDSKTSDEIQEIYAKRNPASEIRPSDVLKTTRKTNYARIDAKELPNLLRQIEVYPGTHVTRLAIKLMALTFVRTSELIGAKWTEFDLKATLWNIPEERMKMRTPHIVPLATQAMEILGTLRELTGGGEWLFPGDRNPKRPMSNNTILKGLERMDTREGWQDTDFAE
jgi:integrase